TWRSGAPRPLRPRASVCRPASACRLCLVATHAATGEFLSIDRVQRPLSVRPALVFPGSRDAPLRTGECRPGWSPASCGEARAKEGLSESGAPDLRALAVLAAQEAGVVAHQEVGLDPLDEVEPDRHDDQQARPA